jgi:[CysO sulfur-carrier protein]-S-L-cysteine hydrolase
VPAVELVIAKPIVQEIIEHCLDEKPCEACGILTGRSGRVLHAYATDNAKRSPVYYEVDPEQQEYVLRAMVRQGEELVAIYHSHPTAAAYPSANDIRLAIHYPDAIRVIVSLVGPADLQAFLIRGPKVQRVRLAVPQEGGATWVDLRSGRSDAR